MRQYGAKSGGYGQVCVSTLDPSFRWDDNVAAEFPNPSFQRKLESSNRNTYMKEQEDFQKPAIPLLMNFRTLFTKGRIGSKLG